MFTSSFKEGEEPIILAPDEKLSEDSSSMVCIFLYYINVFIYFNKFIINNGINFRILINQ